MLGDRRLRDWEVPCELPTTAFPRVGNTLQKTEPGGVHEGFRHFNDVLRSHHGRHQLDLSLYSHLPKHTYNCLKRQGPVAYLGPADNPTATLVEPGLLAQRFTGA